MQEKPDANNDYAEVGECPDCGGTMEWCTCCQVWTQTCCEDYGTCECS